MKLLSRNFYKRDTLQVAYDLLGKKIVRIINGHILAGIIVETEAYRSDDPASHSYRGKTERNKSMFGPVGYTYIYLSYGLHYCLNIVARDAAHISGAVLIRAFIPYSGRDIMARNRRKSLSYLVSGPGNVTQALGLTRTQDGKDVTQRTAELFIGEGIVIDPAHIEATSRIGISVAQEVLWRFIVNKDIAKQVASSFTHTL
jgi:DNA-3-methyladenine glycosylase